MVIAAALSTAPARAQAPSFQVGLQDNTFIQPAKVPADLTALQAVDGSWIRLLLRWSLIVPNGATKPAGFNASDPSDPHYHWSVVDALVRTAAAQHVKLILTLLSAPTWAEGPGIPSSDSSVGPGAWDPNPSEFAAFAHAVALRYSGQFPDPLNPGTDLPAVNYWEIWNEENLPLSLAAPDVVGEYRSLLNASYGAIKGVSPSNVVILGGLAPDSPNPPRSMSPMPFAAQLMCLAPGRRGTFHAATGCPVQAEFDVLGFHPYTLGVTPTAHAANPNDLLIADTGRLVRLVRTAERLHTILPRTKHQLWATEWSWFTNPPQTTFGVPDRTAARYVDYSMWLLWHNDIPLVIWFQIQDPPNASGVSEEFLPGGGLYTSSGRPKLMMRAFSFPLIASVSHRRVYVWGRVPIPRRVRVYVQRGVHGGWRTIARARTQSDGVFVVRARAHGNALYRAYVKGGPVSLGYNTRPIPAQSTTG
jgi:hypothetical protein